MQGVSATYFFCIHPSVIIYFFHLRLFLTDSSVVHGRFYGGAVAIIDGNFAVNGVLTTSGGGAGQRGGIGTGGSSIGTGAVVVVDGGFDVNGILTASGHGAGWREGIRTGGSTIGARAVVVVDGGFKVNGFLTASGGGTGFCDWGDGIRIGG